MAVVNTDHAVIALRHPQLVVNEINLTVVITFEPTWTSQWVLILIGLCNTANQ